MTDPSPPSNGAPDAAAPPDDEHDGAGLPGRLELGGDEPANGLARLVLTLVKLLHDILEKQAIRRMEAGRLSDEQVEQVGQTLKRQAETIEHLCEVFDLEPSDLDLSLGSVQGVDAADLE